MTTPVRTESDVREILNSRKPVIFGGRVRVLVRVPGMAQAEADAWENALEGFRGDCGCRAGAIAMGIFAVALAAYSILDKRPTPVSGVSILMRPALGMAGLILSGALGKLAGLLRARIAFDNTCRRLMERITSSANSAWRSQGLS